MATIYVLRDPRDGAVRYVGKTIIALRTRLQMHVSQARIEARTRRPTPKATWIDALYRLGMRPTIEAIESVDSDPHARERYWIQTYAAQGVDLVNKNCKPRKRE